MYIKHIIFGCITLGKFNINCVMFLLAKKLYLSTVTVWPISRFNFSHLATFAQLIGHDSGHA